MRLIDGTKIALRALRANRLRSGLTTLGIIIGVAAVIAMVAVGSGARAQVAEQIRSFGTNLLLILSGSTTSGGIRLGFGTVLTLTEDDAKAIAAEIQGVEAVAASVRGTAQVVYGDQNWSTLIQGTTPEWFVAREWPVVKGRPFTPQEVDGATKVAVLGQTVFQMLFGEADPLGSIIRIGKVPFTVIGVLDWKGPSTMGSDQDDIIVIPVSTAKQKVLGMSRAGPRSVGSIMVKMRSPDLLDEGERQITSLLRQRHRLHPDQENDFSVRNLAEVFAAQEEIARTLALLLGAIASVSLVVGGIGIMNIMLVSVAERTREIGLRVAVGARSHEILLQFLMEAVTLSLFGGLVGIGLGIGASKVLSGLAGWPTLIASRAILLAFFSSAAVGIFFGYYPARKASRLDPIEALHYE
ncbi:MAG: ABC transporter permease [candidate division NC10 bacterium]|nr:ABC transporter permease [candidate division NC10 bacterium]